MGSAESVVVREGKAVLQEHAACIPSRKMPVFYNPRMAWNRDLFLLVLSAWGAVRDLGIAFAGSGVLGIRSMLELPSPPGRVHLNDLSEAALDLARSNIQKNELSLERFAFTRCEASRFLMDSDGFDALDLDPFGTPVHALKAAVQSLREGALLGVNALDTAALYGTYPRVCMRRYWARSARCDMSREFSARIMIRRVQLEAAAFDKAVWPVLSVVRDHFVRVFFRAERGVPAADRMLRGHGFVYLDQKTGRMEHSPFPGALALGPMWLGGLFDQGVLRRMREACIPDSAQCSRVMLSQLARWEHDMSVDAVGYYDLHALSSRRLAPLRSVKDAARALEGVQSAFEPRAVKTKLPFDEVIRRLS